MRKDPDQRIRKGLYSAGSMFVFLAAISWCLALAAGPASAEEINRTGYTSSKVCGYCHVDIYENWKSSLHALAYKNPIFMTAYRHAYLETKGEAKEYCLKCHTPTIYSTKDTDVTMPITEEGVTCDFCHTVEDVNLNDPSAPFRLDVGGEKRGPMKPKLEETRFFKNPAAHYATYSKWFNKAELCAGCHEIVNSNGIKPGSTYSEWKASSYAKAGVQCQDCHMAPIPGKAIDPSVKKVKKNTIPDHSLSHNMEWMKDAVELEIVTAKRTSGGRYVVDVAMTNVKAGHNIPTGTPSRKLTLEVMIQGEGSPAVTQIRTFGKRVVDKNGDWLTTDVEAYLNGAKIAENTALKPKERRVVRFMFGAAPAGEPKVTARAFLTYSPIVTTEENMHIPLGVAAK